jgi:molybdate transport system ATP-binding protein
MLYCDAHLRRGRFTLAVQLECGAGVTGLFGHSGSGKSSLLGLIAGLIHPQAGKIVLDGEVLFDSVQGVCKPAHRRQIGLVFQDSQLFPHYSVRGNLLYGHALLPAQERRFRFEEIVELLDLAPLLEAHPRQISGGEKQRVALGRSLLAAPRLLLLDEPLAALDGRLKQQILPFLARVKQELALPMIYVSHSLAEIVYLTEQLAFMSAGRVTACGNLRALLEGAGRERLGGLGDDNIFAVTVQAHDAFEGCTLGDLHGQTLALPLRPALRPGDTAYVSVHRGEIALARGRVEGLSIQNQLPGRILGIESQGAAVRVSIDVGATVWAEITPRAWHKLGLQVGDAAHCLIKTRSLAFLSEGEGIAAPLGQADSEHGA